MERFEVLCRAKKYDYENSQDMFKRWLQNYYNDESDDKKKTIIYFAVKKTTSTVTNHIDQIIQKITDFIFENNIYNRNPEPEPEPETEDFIPFSIEPEIDPETRITFVERYWHHNFTERIITERIRKNIQIVLDISQRSRVRKECAICLERKTTTEFACMNCNHSFCVSCVQQLLESQTETRCPCCRRNTTNITVTSQAIQYRYRNIVNPL